MASASSITAIGSTVRHVFLTTQVTTASTAFATSRFNADVVDEIGCSRHVMIRAQPRACVSRAVISSIDPTPSMPLNFFCAL